RNHCAGERFMRIWIEEFIHRRAEVALALEGRGNIRFNDSSGSQFDQTAKFLIDCRGKRNVLKECVKRPGLANQQLISPGGLGSQIFRGKGQAEYCESRTQ